MVSLSSGGSSHLVTLLLAIRVVHEDAKLQEHSGASIPPMEGADDDSACSGKVGSRSEDFLFYFPSTAHFVKFCFVLIFSLLLYAMLPFNILMRTSCTSVYIMPFK